MIDNGSRRSLYIRGVFMGSAGISRGVLWFVPNLGGKPGATAVGALDGEPVRLLDIKPAGDGLGWTARFEAIE